jgi:metallo-beta-lactamase family protein
MSKKKEKIKVSFIGTNSIDVAGSCTHIEMQDYQILLECGLTQGGTVLEDYRINSAKFPFHPSKIDYVFVGHSHIDHIGLLPRLIKEGFDGKVITPKGNKDFIKELCKDCAFIMEKDSESLVKKYKQKQVHLIYTAEHVEELMNHIVEYDFNEKIILNDNISFCFRSSQHIINSAQIELWLSQNNHTKKIVYTSDLGNVAMENNYVRPIYRIDKANLWIGEATYSEATKQLTKKHRKKDLEKLQCVIDQCIENRSSCLLPTFSLHRTQEMITEIYKLYKERDSVNIDFIIASPLANKMCDIFLKELEGEQLELFKEVMSWNKLKRIRDYDSVISLLEDKNPHVWLASSGFMIAGYSRTICSYLLNT